MTRRDLLVALIAVSVTLTGVAATQPKPELLGSQVFDWKDMIAKPNATGEVRTVVRAPTVTLDELEIHITTLKPGEASHAPHQHPNEELLIVREGTVEALVDGQLKRVGPRVDDLPGLEPAAQHQERRRRPGHLSRDQLEVAGHAQGEVGPVTPEDAAATTTLLRAPAAIAAACFLGGAIVGQAVWSNGTLEAAGSAALRCLAVGLVCAPFLLSSRRYRAGRTAMRAWIVAAALAASVRSIYLCVSLFPLPFADWLIAAGVQVALLGALWLAVFAVTRSSLAASTPRPRALPSAVPSAACRLSRSRPGRAGS